jgi:murein DD-endopeptidase MepM/ murein hydrolase activator NlpD
VLALLAFSLPGYSQPELIVIKDVQYKDGSTVITAENHGFVPYTVFLSVDLHHMVSDIELPAKIVVFPSSKTRVLTQLTPDKNRPSSYHYTTDVQLGICNGKMPDTTYVYGLPFKPGTYSRVFYSGRGKAPSPNRYTYVFDLPENTPICAAREGIVANIKEDSKKSGGPKFRDDANYIIVMHDDGSYAWYWHLRQNGVAAQLGQLVSKGEVIGYSGRTGYAPAPALGFAVAYPNDPEPLELDVLFDIKAATPRHLWRGQMILTP